MKQRKMAFKQGLKLGGLAMAVALITGFFGCENALLARLKDNRAAAESPVIGITLDGGDAVASAGYVDFGNVGVGASVDRTLVVSNTGVSSLTIASGAILVTGADAACITVASAPASPIAPGGKSKWVIRCSPTSVGAKTAAVTIASNDVATPVVTINLKFVGIDQVSTPVIVGGTKQSYPDAATSIISVALSCATPNAKIYYTVDGSKPSVDTLGANTWLYTGAITFTLPTKLPAGQVGYIKAFAVAPGLVDSVMVTGLFTRDDIIPPTITASLGGTTVYPENLPLSFTLSSSTTNAQLFLTIDGTVPSTSGATSAAVAGGVSSEGTTYFLASLGTGSFEYKGPHSGATLVVKAYAVVGAITSSVAASSTYTFKLSAPTFAGSYLPSASYYGLTSGLASNVKAQFDVSAATAALGAGYTIKYTNDGATNPASGTPIARMTDIAIPVGVAGSQTDMVIRALVQFPNWQDSAELTGSFHVCGPGVWSNGSNNSKWDQAAWQ